MGKWVYLSVIIDSLSREVLAYNISKNIDLSLVTKTIYNLINSGLSIHHNVHIHSDQGSHYTSPTFRLLLISQSMSRKGNCWDNAVIESFFGHLKDEINISSCLSFNDLQNEISDYIYYYNYLRPQWNLKKMTPVQNRNHLLFN